jgi:lipopolysaccharide biosynthesis protein
LENIKSFFPNAVKHHDTAVVLHLYYPDLWEEFYAHLSTLDGNFDLFVTIPKNVDFREEVIRAQFSNVYIYRCENRGRDILPFLTVFSAIYPLRYKYICKIHTKKSEHLRDGLHWRQDILEKLLGSRERIALAKRAISETPEIGILGPQGHVVSSRFYLGENIGLVEKLALSVGIPFDGAPFSFVAGSMFWFRPEAFARLILMKIAPSDFEPEENQLDGTLAHAFERFFGLLATSSGYQLAELEPGVVTFSTSS